MKTIKIALGACGLIIMIGTRTHHMLVNPQLTEMQALTHYWPFWVLSGVLVIILIIGERH